MVLVSNYLGPYCRQLQDELRRVDARLEKAGKLQQRQVSQGNFTGHVPQEYGLGVA